MYRSYNLIRTKHPAIFLMFRRPRRTSLATCLTTTSPAITTIITTVDISSNPIHNANISSLVSSVFSFVICSAQPLTLPVVQSLALPFLPPPAQLPMQPGVSAPSGPAFAPAGGSGEPIKHPLASMPPFVPAGGSGEPHQSSVPACSS